MSKNLTKCKSCGNMIGKELKRCPHCDSENKKPVYKKWWFWLIIVSVVYDVAIFNATSGDSIDTEDTSIQIVYEKEDIQYMIDELNENALRAEKEYQNKYVEITGKISNIDSDGEYISVEALTAGSFNLDTIMCYINNSQQSDFILTKGKGDIVTIKGKVKSIGEILGYSIDIAEISDADAYSIDINQYSTDTDTYIDTDSDTDNDTTIIEYEKMDIQEMIDDLEQNALRAENKYQNKYIEITGKIASFDSDGEYIRVESLTADIYNYDDILCYIKNAEQITFLLTKSKGDTVIIKGKVTSIGEIIGYYVDIDEIK